MEHTTYTTTDAMTGNGEQLCSCHNHNPRNMSTIVNILLLAALFFGVVILYKKAFA